MEGDEQLYDSVAGAGGPMPWLLAAPTNLGESGCM